MKALRATAALRSLREQSLWRLLAAHIFEEEGIDLMAVRAEREKLKTEPTNALSYGSCP
jgi:hypothetical protein